MRNCWCLLFVLIVAAATEGRAVNPPPQVVPAVQRWDAGEGLLTVRDSPIVVQEKCKKELLPVAAALQADLEAIGCGHHEIRTATASDPGTMFLELAQLPSNSAEPVTMSPERYAITVDDRAVLSALSPTGVFYATRTLLQMLTPNPKAAMLPKGTIIDYPQYRRRMLMLDVGRKPFPIAVLKDYLRILAWYKMNELHLHLSDEAFGGQYAAFRVECDTYPGLASKDCFYTKRQLRELQDMAAGMGITVTPEIDMPGHARVFTNYWPDLCLKGYPNYLDVTNPQTIERLKKLLDEMVPVFDAPDFHIGTDEYQVGGPRQEQLHEAFRRFINTMNAHVRSKGKNCRIWSGFEHMRGRTEIDPSVIVDMWETYDAKAEIAKGHSIINSSDGRTYIVPGAHYYGVYNAGVYNGWEPWMVSGDMSKNPSKDDPKLLGGKLHVWNDQGPTGYTMNEIARLALPSIQVFAEKLWGTKGSKDYAAFQRRAVCSTGFSRNPSAFPPEGGTTSVAVPGVSVVKRAVWANPDGIVLQTALEATLTRRDSFAFLGVGVETRDMHSSGSDSLETADARDNLEYPWTMSAEIFKTAESGTRGVLLSSDLAEICTDYSRIEEMTVKGADGKDVPKEGDSPRNRRDPRRRLARKGRRVVAPGERRQPPLQRSAAAESMDDDHHRRPAAADHCLYQRPKGGRGGRAGPLSLGTARQQDRPVVRRQGPQPEDLGPGDDRQGDRPGRRARRARQPRRPLPGDCFRLRHPLRPDAREDHRRGPRHPLVLRHHLGRAVGGHRPGAARGVQHGDGCVGTRPAEKTADPGPRRGKGMEGCVRYRSSRRADGHLVPDAPRQPRTALDEPAHDAVGILDLGSRGIEI